MAQHGYLPEYDEEISSDRDERNGSEREFMFGGGDEERFGRGRTDHPDAHYLSWRDRHMRELDHDYEEFRREREQQFHQDFNAWRRQRSGNRQPLQPGRTQTGPSTDPSGAVELARETGAEAVNEPDAMGAATSGTNLSGRRGS